jgi:crotonobetainyl-CoA:carnitine CoA-transferase CaiB-like acyl-CoA transferase
VGATPEAPRGLNRTARAYAARLLADLGQRPLRPLELTDEHPALAWARSGLMALTGTREGAPQMCPAPLAACADGALAALASLAPEGRFAGLGGAQLLAERAAITGHSRNGAVSPGGSCRLLEAADGNLALNLAREDDWTLLPAWLEQDVAPDWDAVARAVRGRVASELVARGRELGLAVAVDHLRTDDCGSAPWARLNRGHGPLPQSRPGPRVIDLSSLWAGPLCGQLLRLAGAEVIKVESTARPDGARQGPRPFFDLLNAGKASVALDLGSAAGRRQLNELLDAADIVIEASRPRALRQLGIESRQWLADRPGRTWLGITGHGRDPARENWIAYGDDAGVAAGLSAIMREATGQALIVGDAIADPLTGVHAALAAWAAWRGGGGLVSLSLSGVAAHCAGFQAPAEGWAARTEHWAGVLAHSGVGVAPPQARPQRGLARPLGADAGILEAA